MKQEAAEQKRKMIKGYIAGAAFLLLPFVMTGIVLYAIHMKDFYLLPYDARTDRKSVKGAMLLERSEEGDGICMVVTGFSGLPLMVSDQYVVQDEYIHPKDSKEGEYKTNFIIYNIETDQEQTVMYEDYKTVLPDDLTYTEDWRCLEEDGEKLSFERGRVPYWASIDSADVW